MKEALFWETDSEKHVICTLCPHRCRIGVERTGICGVRKNVGGTLYAETYSRISSLAFDPIEKKPLYHFYPGSAVLSVGSVGCNLGCEFCQNWQISQNPKAPTRTIEPETLVRIGADAHARDPRMVGIAYTYNEPFIWYEFVSEAVKLASDAGLENVLVTNGYVNEAPLRRVLPFIGALNIDLKGFSNDYYTRVCKAALEPVLNTIRLAHEMKCHIEITTLLVPGENDSAEEVDALTRWLGALDRSIPLHLARYFPNYKFETPPTSIETMHSAREIALRHLDYVYLGNLWEPETTDTHCPACGKNLIARSSGKIRSALTDDSACPACGKNIVVRGEIAPG